MVGLITIMLCMRPPAQTPFIHSSSSGADLFLYSPLRDGAGVAASLYLPCADPEQKRACEAQQFFLERAVRTVTCHHARPLDTVDTSQQIFPDHQYQSQWPPSPTPSSDIRYLLFTFLDLPKAKYIYAYLAQKAQLSIEYWCPNTYFLMFCDKVLTAFLMYLWRQYWYAKLRRKALHDIDPEIQFCLYKALGDGCHHY